MTQPDPARPTRARQRRLLAIALCTFWLPALVVTAQPAINSGASVSKLPLRNIQIEVRQVQRSSQERSGVQASGSIGLDSRGNSDAQLRLQMGDRQDQRSSTAQQQVLVLNGRSAAIALRSSTPFRLMQTQFRNGVPIQVPGVVLLDASTGFSAIPRWDGSDVMELELSATQAGAASSMGRGMPPTSTNSASTVLIPVGEWVTVAQSDTGSQSSGSGWGGQGAQSAQQFSELQVRLTVR